MGDVSVRVNRDFPDVIAVDICYQHGQAGRIGVTSCRAHGLFIDRSLADITAAAVIP